VASDIPEPCNSFKEIRRMGRQEIESLVDDYRPASTPPSSDAPPAAERTEEFLKAASADTEAKLEKANERIGQLETLLEALGVQPGFGLEYVLRNVCARHAMRTKSLADPHRSH
jgi:hypothetical protein